MAVVVVVGCRRQQLSGAQRDFSQFRAGGYDSGGSVSITDTLRTITTSSPQDFGVVTPAQSQSDSITVSNSGGQPLTINQAAPRVVERL